MYLTSNSLPYNSQLCFDVLLTVHLSIFISVFNQLDAQNMFHNKFYFMPPHVSSTCVHHQEVKIALHSLWYHHTYRCDDTRGCVMQYGDKLHLCVVKLLFLDQLYSSHLFLKRRDITVNVWRSSITLSSSFRKRPMKQ